MSNKSRKSQLFKFSRHFGKFEDWDEKSITISGWSSHYDREIRPLDIKLTPTLVEPYEPISVPYFIRFMNLLDSTRRKFYMYKNMTCFVLWIEFPKNNKNFDIETKVVFFIIFKKKWWIITWSLFLEKLYLKMSIFLNQKLGKLNEEW